MTVKLLNAPNIKKQPKEALNVKILIGSQAWEFAKAEQRTPEARSTAEMELDKTLPSEATAHQEARGGAIPPIVVDEKVLANLTAYRLIPSTAKYITLQRANQAEKLPEQVITTICKMLTEQSKANAISVQLYDEAMQLLEDLSGYCERIRQGDTQAELIKQKQAEAEAEHKSKEEQEQDFENYYNSLGDNGKLAEFLKWQKSPLKRHDQSGELYRYTGKKWEVLELDGLGRLIRQFFNEKGIKKYSAVKIKKLIDLLAFELEETPTASPDLLAFNNGILNKVTGEFYAHDQKFFLTSFINADYLEDAQEQPTPHFDKWLNFISEENPEREKTILSGLFMVLINANNWQLFIEVTGRGGTGKSTYTEIAKLLAGENNHVGITLKALDNEVMRYAIIDKTLIISGDQARYTGDGATIRAITGGDDLFFNPKHKPSFSRKVNAVFMTTNNTPILFTENSGGTERRRVIFKFDRIVPVEERDFNLMNKIRGEIGGVIKRLFHTFPEPLEAKSLLEKQRVSKEALAVKMEVNHVLEFAQEFEIRDTINGLTVGNARDSIMGEIKNENQLTAIYPSYRYFCSMNDIEPINKRAFTRAFKQAMRELDKGEYLTRESNGRTITNVYFTDRLATLNHWNS